jgi:hypothetical protein
VIACLASAVLAALMATAHARGLSDAGVVNVGYPPHDGPVPLIGACLDPQLVSGTTTTVYAGAAAEPSIAVNPRNDQRIVATWQQGRIDNGGALEGGIAYSRDGGLSWQRTTVPFQACVGGTNQRTSDVWLSYAPDGSRLYLSALVVNATTDPRAPAQAGIVITTSEDDGATWAAPHFVASSPGALDEPTGQFPFDDKNSVTADPHDGLKAYVVWDRGPQAISPRTTTQISRTVDGGTTWSPPQTLYDPFPDLTRTGRSNGIEDDAQTINNIVLVQPRAEGPDGSDERLRGGGDLLNFMVRIYATPGATDAQYRADDFPFPYTRSDVAVVRSQDQGVTWETAATVVTPLSPALVFTGGYTYDGGRITGGVGTLLRTGDVTPSVNINPRNGFLYAAYQSNGLRSDQLPQVALVTSRDGGRTWSPPALVSRTPPGAPNPQAFNPFVAVSERGRVGVIYYDFRNDDPADPDDTMTDTWLAIYQEVDDPRGGSTGLGLDFVREVRLSSSSFIAQHGPLTTHGVMVSGDYPFLVAHADRFYAIYTKSFKGPFTPSSVFLSDPERAASIVLDDNFRQAPFVSIVPED